MIMKIFNQKANFIQNLQNTQQCFIASFQFWYFEIQISQKGIILSKVIDYHLILSTSKFFWHLLSFFQLVLFCFCSSIDSHTLLDISITIREPVLFSLLFLSFSILISLFGSYCLLRLFTILFCINRRCPDTFSIFYVLLLIFIYHKIIQISRQFILEQWSDIILQGHPFISEEIIKNAVSSQRKHSSKNQVIIVLPFKLITKSVISLIDLNKFFISFLVARIIFGMILKSQFSISCFDFIKRSIFRESKNTIVIIQGVRIVLIKELLLFFTLQTMLIKEFLEC